ncbi:MAG: hypothetical protein ACXVCD_19055 [Pseudobdellovibrionaceae bacterium]
MMSLLVPVPTSGMPHSISSALSLPNFIRTSPENFLEVQNAIDILDQSVTVKPSAAAGIKGPIYASVQLIDRIFMLAVKNYGELLIRSSAKDMASQISVISYPELYAGGVGAMEIVSKYTPDSPVIQYLCIFILAIFGYFWGRYNQEKIIKEKREEEKSIHRLGWAYYVSFEEKSRIKKSLALAKERVRILAQQVMSGDRSELLDQHVFDELYQLHKVIKAISENDLTVNYNGDQIPISQFIDHFRIRKIKDK